VDAFGCRFHRASFPRRSAFFHAKEEIVKKKIGVLVLGAALAFGMSTGAWAQGGGAGGEQAEREAR
jgi:hypothetical protein